MPENHLPSTLSLSNNPVEQLQLLWSRGVGPEITDYFQQWKSAPNATLADLLRVDQRERWKREEKRLCERYFAEFPQIAEDPENAVLLLYSEALLRMEFGEFPELIEYQNRFPQFHKQLATQWEVHDALAGGAIPAHLLDVTSSLSAQPPPNIDGYEMLEEIGRGAIGVVYRARQWSLGRMVAIKMILETPFGEPEKLLRFLEEARLIAKLEHPNIVNIFDVGKHAGRPYIALELLTQGNLAGRLHPTKIAIREIAELIETLARAVQYAHDQGIIHRDLKPANILLASASWNPRNVKIADFGLAKQSAMGLGATRTGQIIGTPAYMAPEQALGSRAVGPAADIYSLGVLLYEGLTGRPPLQGSSVPDTLRLVVEQDPISPTHLNSQTPRDLATICMKCLEKQPERRYASAAALADDLRRFLDGESIVAIPIGRIEKGLRWVRRNRLAAGFASVAVLSLVSGIVGAGLFAWRASQSATQALNSQSLADSRAIGEAEARETAEKQRTRAEWTAYSGMIQRAHQEWQDNNVSRFFAILDGVRWDFQGPEYHLLRNTAHRNHAPIWGHHGVVRAVAYSPDQSILASAGENGVLNFWDRNGNLLRRFPRTGVQWTSLAFTTAGDLLAGGLSDGKVALINISDGAIIHEFNTNASGVLALCFAPKSRNLLVGGNDPNIGLWDGSSAMPLRSFAGHKGPVTSLAVDSTGAQFVSGSRDGSARVWEIASGKSLREFREHKAEIGGVAWAPKSNRIASVGKDRLVRIWNGATGDQEKALEGHFAEIFCVQFGSDGKQLVTGAMDRSTRLWDVDSGKSTLLRGSYYWVTSVAIAPNQKEVVGGSAAGGLHRFNIARPDGPRRFPCIKTHDHYFRFSPDGDLLALAAPGNLVEVWNVGSMEKRYTLNGHAKTVTAVAFRPRSNQLASSDMYGEIKIWDLKTKQATATLRGHYAMIRSLCYSPDGSFFATVAQDKTCRIWDSDTGKMKRELTGHTNDVLDVAIDPTGRNIATCSYDRTVRIWNVADGTLLHTLPHAVSVTRLVYSADGKRIYTSGWEDIGREWDTQTGKLTRIFRGNAGSVTGISVTSDRSRAFSTSADRNFRIWNADRGYELLAIRENVELLYGVTCSPDNRWVAYGVTEGYVNVWDIRPEFPPPSRNLKGHTTTVTSLAISSDGKQLATMGADGAVRLWSTVHGQQEQEFLDHGAKVLAGAYAGNRLFTADETGKILCWNPATGERIAREYAGAKPIYHLLSHPQLPTLYAATAENVIRLDQATLTPTTNVIVGESKILGIALSPTGDTLVVADARPAIRTRDTKTLTERGFWEAPGSMIGALAWAPNNQYVAGALHAGGVALWNPSTGKIQSRIERTGPPLQAIAIDASSRFVVAGASDNKFFVWEANTGRLLLERLVHSAPITSLVFHPNSKSFYSGSYDSTAKATDWWLKTETTRELFKPAVKPN